MMAVGNVTRDVKGHAETSSRYPDDAKACEVDFVEIFRIEKQVRDAEVFPEVAGDHREENDPAQEQNDIPLEII